MSPTDQRLLSDHTFALRAHEAAMRDLRPFLAAALPQVFGLGQLADRWALSQPQVVAVLAQHAGLPPAEHRATYDVRIPVEVVLRLDDIVKAHASVPPEAGLAAAAQVVRVPARRSRRAPLAPAVMA